MRWIVVNDRDGGIGRRGPWWVMLWLPVWAMLVLPLAIAEGHIVLAVLGVVGVMVSAGYVIGCHVWWLHRTRTPSGPKPL
jgi:hypothetical protein